jgi:ketosteroid isomerase-like protein
MKLRLYVISVLALALLFVPRLWAQDTQVDSVLKAREAALAAGDLDAILRLFADDAIVVTSSGRFLIGKEQIRG